MPNFFKYLSWNARSKSWTDERGESVRRLRSSSLISSTLSIPCTASRIITFFSSIKGRSSLGFIDMKDMSGFSLLSFSVARIALLSWGKSIFPKT